MTERFWKILIVGSSLIMCGLAWNAYALPRFAPHVACIIREADGQVQKAWGDRCYQEGVVVRMTAE